MRRTFLFLVSFVVAVACRQPGDLGPPTGARLDVSVIGPGGTPLSGRSVEVFVSFHAACAPLDSMWRRETMLTGSNGHATGLVEEGLMPERAVCLAFRLVDSGNTYRDTVVSGFQAMFRELSGPVVDTVRSTIQLTPR